MKFSVVIPCYDRLAFLKEAIYTVLQQDWNDWELIVFDNASEKNLADYVQGLADSRIHYDRSDERLSVTDSWNRAINMARGDYVVFLGDDDGLTPKYFSRIAPIIEKFDRPEILYSAIYQFMHPGVAPWALGGYIAEVKNGFFFTDQKEPFALSCKQALKAVKGSVKLRRNFAFNIQAFIFSRVFLNRLKQDGPIFRSSYPDYYIANVALLRSKSTVVIPEPMTIAGVCKASVGYALFNGFEDNFMKLLNMELQVDPVYKDINQFVLPGPVYNTNYILAMEYVVRHAPLLSSCKVDFGRYRRLQIYSILMKNRNHGWKCVEADYWSRLEVIEKIWTFGIFLLLQLAKRSKLCSRLILACLKYRVEAQAFTPLTRTCDEDNYHQLVDVFNAIREGILV